MDNPRNTASLILRVSADLQKAFFLIGKRCKLLPDLKLFSTKALNFQQFTPPI